MLTETNVLNPHKWVTAYADYLYMYAIVRINDEDTAKDLVQETFWQPLKKWTGLRAKAPNERGLPLSLKIRLLMYTAKNHQVWL
ncbi:hypothetical protein ACRQ5D_08795 [Mucilaginibacter sp. P25]|uniref:hypothetical protein n=1 Tax=unclassified Mucilaginibacter TaxID=2617802 RepID=UPI003D66649A